MSDNAVAVALFIAIAIAIASPFSCTSCSINECGKACSRAEKTMLSYSPTRGCVCGDRGAP